MNPVRDNQMMKLVIVESPTKAKTIQKFLSSDYVVKSSFGHIRDLPKSELGIDVAGDFTPSYVIPPKARPHLSEIKKTLKESSSVILATDEDREGEAIAWHLTQALELEKTAPRIVFHEITKGAIENALKNPREINMNLVDAQQARRVLDRLVGYKLSPFLWKKVARGLSAGRVQSAAVRLIVDKEREIQAFKAEEYWTIEAELRKSQNFRALLTKIGEEIIPKLGIKTKEQAEKILKNLEGSEYRVSSIERKEVRRNPLPPFTTSTLQQEASKKFGMPSKMTMSQAQSLYEQGYITYHRTDALNLSQQALQAAKEFIGHEFGEMYCSPRTFKTKSKGAQEAHEAIRPAFADSASVRSSESLNLEPRQKKIYDLIWRRFVASQMSQALFDATTVDIAAANHTFRAHGSILKFDGFLKVYPVKFEETELPKLQTEELLELKELIPARHFTQPPARFSEATLIKELEKNGIGRPSTYAPIISTIQERNYVTKNEQKKFQPTDVGMKVNDLLVLHFPQIVDVHFTAEMEEDLDHIAKGEKQWVPMIRTFYEPFAQRLAQKYEEVQKQTLIQETTDKICPKCGKPLIIRFGRFGKFYACAGFPSCRHTEPLEEKNRDLHIACPKCAEGSIFEKQTRKHKIFYSCNRYPACDFALWDKPNGTMCEKCGSLLVEKKKGVQCSNKECV